MRKTAFIVAGTSSGTGKTTITLGLMAVLSQRGFNVQPFKAGPDYIDPSHHGAVCSRPSYNLDTWMMGEEGARKTFAKKMQDADVGIVEGVMGLFDGRGGGDEAGSTAHLSKVLGIPVILVIDAAGMAGSAAAMVQGFENFDDKVNIAGVIFNRVGSERHFTMLKESVEDSCRAKVLGYVAKDQKVSIPERHLGLVMAGEREPSYEPLARLVSGTVDIDSLLTSSHVDVEKPGGQPAGNAGKDVTIAVARDKAFCFYYQENLDILEELGARLVFFSPIDDGSLPEGVAGIYIGGGYPELCGERLESNRAMRKAIKEMAEKGMPIYAECGGLIYLGSCLKNGESRKSFDMTGLFPWQASMGKRLKALGYREVAARKGLPFLEEGEKIRGHEFRYSGIQGEGGLQTVYAVSGRGAEAADEGYLYRQTIASYIHLHFGSNPRFAEGFISRCREWLNETDKMGPEPYS